MNIYVTYALCGILKVVMIIKVYVGVHETYAREVSFWSRNVGNMGIVIGLTTARGCSLIDDLLTVNR